MATQALSELAAKVHAGERVTVEEARALLAARDLIQLGMLASDARARRHGARATFIRVCDVPLGRADVDELPLETAGELRLVGKPPSAEEAIKAVRLLVARGADVPVTGFAVQTLRAVAESDGALTDLLRGLKEAGLSAVAEASAEHIGPSPLRQAQGRPERSRETTRRARSAQGGASLAPLVEADVPLARLVVEEPLQPETAPTWLDEVRRWQEEWNLIRAVAPLARQQSEEAPTTGFDDVRLVALARLLLDNVETIQTNWRRSGAKLAQVTLMFGADDLDDVPARDRDDLGPRRNTLEEVRRNIRAASLEPVERNARFEGLAR